MLRELLFPRMAKGRVSLDLYFFEVAFNGTSWVA